MKRVSLTLKTLLFLLFVNSCSSPERGQGPYLWNVLVYLAADNNLERFAVADFKDMELIGSDNNINILVLFDRSPGYDKSLGNWSNTRLYRVLKNKDSDTIGSTLLKDYEELDMTDPKTLRDFLLFAYENYPAENTLLILWSHGTGVYPNSIGDNISTLGIIHDDSRGYDVWDTMLTGELEWALKGVTERGYKKVDIINFDACLMQMLEVSWQLTGAADYMVAAQPNIPGPGNNYKTILEYLTSSPSATPQELALFLVDSFYEEYRDSLFPTALSAITLKEPFLSFQKKFASWSEQLTALEAQELLAIAEARRNIESYDTTFHEYVDLNSFAEAVLLLTEGSNIPLHRATEELSTSVGEIVLSSYATGSYRDALHGLSINLPYTQKDWGYYQGDNEGNNGYDTLKISSQSSWFDFINKLAEHLPASERPAEAQVLK